MSKSNREFTFEVNVLTRLPERGIKLYGADTPILSYPTEEGWKDIVWRDFASQVDTVACAMLSLGITVQEQVAMFSANRPECLVADFACYAIRAVSVSVYATSSEEQLEYIVKDAGCKLLIVGNRTQYNYARSLQRRYPKLSKIVVIKPIELDPDDLTTLTWKRFMTIGAESAPEKLQEVEALRSQATPEDIATLVYTSGTTGEPKGAILPHSNFDAAMEAHRRRLVSVTSADVSMAFLPLSHIFEKGWTYFCLTKGVKVAVNRDPHDIQQSIQEVHPTCMCSVPRFWEKVHTAVLEKIAGMNPAMQAVVRSALKVGSERNLNYARRGLKAPFWLEMRYRFFNKYVFSQLRKAIGFRDCNIFPTAGALVSDKIVDFFRSCGLNIVVGYGLSETTATVTCFPYIDWQMGSVGTPIPFVKIRIGKNDEVQTQSPMVMRGYFNKPRATAEAFTPDGWLRTGDAGYIDNNGNLFLTDRIKDLFKTSNGKYIAPQAIETLISQDKYIEQLAVIGDGRKFVSALVVPNFELIINYAKDHKIPFNDVSDLVKNGEIIAMITGRIDKQQEGLAPYEKIKRFTLLDKDFTMDSGVLTNTLKIRRKVINQLYGKLIDKMYEEK